MRSRRQPDERGATSTEYAMLVFFIALAIVAGVMTFGTALDTAYAGFAGRVTSLL